MHVAFEIVVKSDLFTWRFTLNFLWFYRLNSEIHKVVSLSINCAVVLRLCVLSDKAFHSSNNIICVCLVWGFYITHIILNELKYKGKGHSLNSHQCPLRPLRPLQSFWISIFRGNMMIKPFCWLCRDNGLHPGWFITVSYWQWCCHLEDRNSQWFLFMSLQINWQLNSDFWSFTFITKKEKEK